MHRLIVSNTTTSIKFENYNVETVETNIGSSKGNDVSGTFLNKEISNVLRTYKKKHLTREI